MHRLFLLAATLVFASPTLSQEQKTPPPCNVGDLEIANAQLQEDAVVEKNLQLQIKHLQAELSRLKRENGKAEDKK